MDFNEEQELISMSNVGNSDEDFSGNGVAENGHTTVRHSPSYNPGMKASVLWLDLRVFYVRISKCMIDDDSTPEHLTLNHVPLNHDTLLEVNGVRTSIYADGVSTLLKCDRLDKKYEEVTFVSTDSIRMTGSLKFKVFHNDILVLSGTLELCHSNGFIGESRNHGQSWSMDCQSDFLVGSGFFKGSQHMGLESSSSPSIEVYVAGSFVGSPVILTKTVQLSHRRKQTRKGMLESIPEYEATTESQEGGSSSFAMEANHQDKDSSNPYSGMEYLEGEDGEFSWFSAGVRVGVGIGLSICLGVGIGVGLLVRTYQGTTRNFKRRLL